VVYLYYTRLLGVDITCIEVPRLKTIEKYESRRHMIETTLIRVDDIKTIMEMSFQIYDKNLLTEDGVFYKIMKKIILRSTKIEKRRKYVTPSIYDTFTSPYFHIVSYLTKERHRLA